ncbi:MAG: hypothetical protein JWM43_1765 [Acidobacteriaceae bacterium]|nr:hypothetical protein [Acidobacteriaceae bacterium]
MNSKWLKAVSAGVMVAGLAVPLVPLPMMAQAAPAQAGAVDHSISSPADGATHAWTQEQLMSSTVHEAWVLSGRNEDQFFEMVRELSAISAQKRGLTLPDNQEAGVKAGNWIKKEARRDPDQLLYAVVDKAVVKTGVKSTTATK